jgi:uncharacterized protein YbjT (DUF2867 family)
MKIILFGATGMVGQGVLRECLLDPAVSEVLSIVRSTSGTIHAKLKEIVHADLFNLVPMEASLRGYDVCFFSIGVSAVGLSEKEYSRWNMELPVSVAQTLVRINPQMTFIYVSGQGTDSSEQGLMMWARVKGKTENAILRMPFKAVYMFRPGMIQPMHGIESKTKLYRVIYKATAPLIPFLTAALPQYVTTTERLGRAVLNVAQNGYPKPHIETRDINQLH